MKRWRELSPGGRRAFAALLFAAAIEHTGFGAVFPVLPLLVTGRGNDVGVVAAMAAAFILAAFTFQYPMAYIADRFGRRRVLAIALLGNAVLALLFLLHLSPALLVVVRLLQGLSAGASEPASRGLVSDLIPNDYRGQAFGTVASAEMLGIIAGPLLGGGVAAFFPLEYVFILQAALSAVGGAGFLLLTRGLREHHPVGATGANPLAGLRRLLTVDLIGLGLLAAASSYLFGLYDTIWVLFMNRLGAGVAVIGLSITIFGIPLFLAAPLAGRLGDRFGRVAPAIVGTLAVGVIAGLYPLMPGVPYILGLGLVEGLMFAVLRPNLYALIAAAAPEGMESRAQAAAGVMGIVGNLVAPSLAAFLWSRDYHLAFYSGAAFVIGLGLLGGTLVLRPGNRVGSRRVPSALLPGGAGEPRAPAVGE